MNILSPLLVSPPFVFVVTPPITPGQHAMFTLDIFYTKFTLPVAGTHQFNTVSLNTDFTVPRD